MAGNIKVAGFIACVPYIVNFLLRARSRFRWTVGSTDQQGNIWTEKLDALWALTIYKRPQPEIKVVVMAWTIQAAFGVLAVAYALFTRLD